MDSGDNNSQNKDLMYRRCPYCGSLIRADLWNCPVCNGGLNPIKYKERKERMKYPEQYRKEQHRKQQQWEQQDMKEVEHDDNEGCGVNKGCGGCLAVIIGIIAFIGIIILLNNLWIIGLGIIICIAGAIGYAAYESITG